MFVYRESHRVNTQWWYLLPCQWLQLWCYYHCPRWLECLNLKHLTTSKESENLAKRGKRVNHSHLCLLCEVKCVEYQCEIHLAKDNACAVLDVSNGDIILWRNWPSKVIWSGNSVSRKDKRFNLEWSILAQRHGIVMTNVRIIFFFQF